MARYSEAVWALVRIDVEQTELALDAIATRHGIARGTITSRASREGWMRPLRPTKGAVLRAADRNSLVARLFRSFERQIADLERRFAEPDVEADEKDARTLGVLARTFETLNALKAGETEATADAPVDLEDLRSRLAAGLAGLARHGAGYDGADRGADAR